VKLFARIGFVLNLFAPLTATAADEPFSATSFLTMMADVCPKISKQPDNPDPGDPFYAVDDETLVRALGAGSKGRIWRTDIFGPGKAAFISFDRRTSTCGAWAESIDATELEETLSRVINGMRLTVFADKDVTLPPPASTESATRVLVVVLGEAGKKTMRFALIAKTNRGDRLSGLPAQATVQLTHEGAMDANAILMLDMTVHACGNPLFDGVDRARNFVAEHGFQPIAAPNALRAMVGDGDLGGAWSTFNWATGNGFAVSIRGHGQACSVWGEYVEPAGMEKNFRSLIEGIAAPDTPVTLVGDEELRSSKARGKRVSYRIDNLKLGRSISHILQVTDMNGTLVGGLPMRVQILVGHGEPPEREVP